MKLKEITTVGIILFFAVACKNDHKSQVKNINKDTTQVLKKMTLYTCPMHHQIRLHKPGKCPICGMTLIPVKNSDEGTAGNKTKNTDDKIAKISIPGQQQFLANIHTDTASRIPLSGQLLLTGTTVFDPYGTQTISAWVSGWIEKMFVRNPGEKVSSGQKLYDIYSPDLLSAEKDYLLAIKQKRLFKEASVDLPDGQAGISKTIEALKQKLKRWGLSKDQIEQLGTQSQPSGKVSIYSKSSGYLTKKLKVEGDFVKEGDAVLDVVKNNTLWVQAQLYDTELPLLNADPKIWVALDAFPGKKLSGKIVFNNPVNENDSRVHLLNIAIPNAGGKIQPGMLAYVHLQTSKGVPVVTIPKSAVIYGEKNNYVWIRLPDDSPASPSGSFERRKVKLGKDNSTMVQVLQGIKAGEQVVSSGAYLVNSEYILKHGSGVNMAGMQMSDMKMSGKSK